MVRKMKAIYHTLNLFNMDVTKKCLIGECWLPIKDRDIVQQALSDGSVSVSVIFISPLPNKLQLGTVIITVFITECQW